MTCFVYVVKDLGVEPRNFLGIVNIVKFSLCFALLNFITYKSTKTTPTQLSVLVSRVSDTRLVLLLDFLVVDHISANWCDLSMHFYILKRIKFGCSG